MKFDTQIEENYRRTISYLQGYSSTKLYCRKLGNQKPTANTVRNARRTTLCWMRGKVKEQLSIKLTMYLPPSLLEKISTKQDIASTKIFYQFLAPTVPFLRKNKATNSSFSTDPFSAAMRTLVLGNLFKLVRFVITFARAVCHWG